LKKLFILKFQSMLEKLKYDQNLRVVIARSTTPGIFSAG